MDATMELNASRKLIVFLPELFDFPRKYHLYRQNSTNCKKFPPTAGLVAVNKQWELHPSNLKPQTSNFKLQTSLPGTPDLTSHARSHNIHGERRSEMKLHPGSTPAQPQARLSPRPAPEFPDCRPAAIEREDIDAGERRSVPDLSPGISRKK